MGGSSIDAETMSKCGHASTRLPPVRQDQADPELDSLRWLPVLTVLTSTVGLAGAVWVAVSMLF
jgi:hypothetical protein